MEAKHLGKECGKRVNLAARRPVARQERAAEAGPRRTFQGDGRGQHQAARGVGGQEVARGSGAAVRASGHDQHLRHKFAAEEPVRRGTHPICQWLRGTTKLLIAHRSY